MTRRASKPDEAQVTLPLPCDPAGQDALRAAYSSTARALRESGIRTFEEALARPAVRLCLTRVARHIVTARS